MKELLNISDNYTEFIKDYLKSKNLKISKISIITDEDSPLPYYVQIKPIKKFINKSNGSRLIFNYRVAC
ncbi:MAG: hypothetical protein DSY59_02325 [Persephonella sp.]|nr:MAG: hypothetical protein DSY59_02325 [Persephonella sp.]